MRDLAIVAIDTIDLENCTSAGQDDYPQSPGSAMTSPPLPVFSDHIQSQPAGDMKVFEMQTTIRCQDRQLQRLQNDQHKRIQDYRELRHKLETDTNGMQKQIDGIRTELQKMYVKTMQVEEMRGRVARCEEQNVQMQIHNDSEFQILRSVMKNVCGRIDRMEELQLVERDFQIQNVQHRRYQEELLQNHSILLQQQQEQEHTRQHNIVMEDSRHAHEHAPAPLIQSQASKPYSYRGLTPRAPCPKCHKDLAKIYIKTHLKFKRCQI